MMLSLILFRGPYVLLLKLQEGIFPEKEFWPFNI